MHLFTPNHELSRLTYYAVNRPGKMNKLGGELEKRVKAGCYKAQYGNVRARAYVTLDSLSSDLEVVARAASVFTAWCTFTDGHVIEADSNLARDYLSVLRRFAQLSTAEVKSVDHELRNR
ncbi:hypothetical protein BDR04DRAFT_1000801 [Suillus decipiens]|nr:hypothetical protein BDR04DRAFT_1000801 [Suillus decipiens]